MRSVSMVQPHQSDRVMATSLTARWRYVGTEISWDLVYADVHRLLPLIAARKRSVTLNALRE